VIAKCNTLSHSAAMDHSELNINVTPKITEQHLVVCSGKSEA